MESTVVTFVVKKKTVVTILNFQIRNIGHYSELLNGALTSWNNQSLLPYCHKKNLKWTKIFQCNLDKGK
jgi:hypothetical protein